jgi:hypothetical protein
VLSSALCGTFTPGIVLMVLGRVRELLADAPALHPRAWSRATTTFALVQAIAAYGMSYLLAATGNYVLLFGLASGALVLALVIDFGSSITAARGFSER